jgi:multicomponent Na+:H+ antiporter subunit A
MLLLFVLLPALTAGILALLPTPSKAPNILSIKHRWIAAIPAFVALAVLIQPDPLTFEWAWLPSLGVSLSFVMDGLARLFTLIITGIGALVLIYAGGYFESADDYKRFGVFALLFMTAMLGIVTSMNLIGLFMFWELTSFSSFLLIGFNHEKASAREGARRALIITGGGGLALLAGLTLIGIMGGSMDIRTLDGNAVRSSALYIPALILVFAGAFSKSAQFPLHFWLPGAMDAPTPASAYLHSATMVKAGIFLLARMTPVLGGTEAWINTLLVVGLFTFIYGAVFALRQTDLKAILAYSTISWLGALTALAAPGTEESALALSVGVLAHALYKGALFLVAGSVDHAVHTRDITRLGGLGRDMPITSAVAGIAALSMAGIPPLMGFLAKETLKATAYYSGSMVFMLLTVVGSALTVLVALRVVYDTFFGAAKADHHAHEAPISMWSAPAILGSFTVFMPLAISGVVEPLVLPTVESITRELPHIHLHLFEGFTPPFVMSLIGIALGVAGFAVRERIIGAVKALPEFTIAAPNTIYRWIFDRAVPNTAQWLVDHLQNGVLRDYERIMLGAMVALILFALVAGGSDFGIRPSAFENLGWTEFVVCILLCLGAFGTIAAQSRLTAIVILGIDGALVSLLFVMFGAPDVAFTQLMIEVVSLVLLVLAFHFLPDYITIRSPRREQFRDILFAALVGVTVTVLVLVAETNPVAPPISRWYIDNAVPIGQGHNVVNVVVVDFRGMDTLGEITVLIIAAIGVVALLRLRPTGQTRGKRLNTDTETTQ